MFHVYDGLIMLMIMIAHGWMRFAWRRMLYIDSLCERNLILLASKVYDPRWPPSQKQAKRQMGSLVMYKSSLFVANPMELSYSAEHEDMVGHSISHFAFLRHFHCADVSYCLLMRTALSNMDMGCQERGIQSIIVFVCLATNC